MDLEASGRAGCLHKWVVLPSPGPSCSENIVRVMKCLLPILEVSLHVRAGKKTAEVAIEVASVIDERGSRTLAVGTRYLSQCQNANRTKKHTHL